MRGRMWWVGVALWGALALPAQAGRLAQDPGSAEGAALVINEVQYDPPSGGNESAYEWVELYNPGGVAVGLAGWQLADARVGVPLPDVAVEPDQFLVVAAGDGFAEQHPGFPGRVVVLGGRIGNGLGNSGDQVRLLAPDGRLVDGLSYGDDTGVLNPSAPDVPAEHSLARVPAGRDTDTAADWVDQSVPSPGGPETETSPTPSPTAAPPPTLPAGARVVLNEYLPAPKAVDWDGDGQVTTADEWVELYNGADVPISLRGWLLDDTADGGSTPYPFPDAAVVPPRGHLVVFARESKLSLNNQGDAVRLLGPGGAVVDETAYSRSTPDGSYSRQGDGAGPWTDALPPSPGRANGTGPGPGPTAPAATPGPTPTGRPTPTKPGGTPAPAYLPLLLSEVLADPLAAGDDAAEEWVELFNPSAAPVSLAGWAVGDGQAWDALPDVLVPARGFAVVAGRAVSAPLAAAGVVVAPVADGRIGNGLANGGDLVRLRGPTGALADAMSYGANLTAFDPAVPLGPPGSSWERIPPDADTDTAEDWWLQPAPTPGTAGARRTEPPRVVLNEVLPAPAWVDWDGDGVAGHTDEWLELANLADYPVALAGWRLVVGDGAGWGWRIPPEARLAAGEHLVLPRSVTGLALVNGGDTVRLIRADGVTADAVTWAVSPGYDRSLGRLPDGTGGWQAGLSPTPGAANVAADDSRTAVTPPPTAPVGEATPAPVPEVALAALRSLPAGTRVQVRGRVTAAPGHLGRRVLYLGDETGGVRVYLGYTDVPAPAWALGERVGARGRLSDYHGERQLVVERAADAWSAGRDGPLPPARLRTGGLGEAVEGRLLALTGRVVATVRTGFTLDDGSGPARVVLPTGPAPQRPTVRRGQRLTVVGLASQSAARAPWQGGYRLLVRGPADVTLPRPTGGASTLLPARHGAEPRRAAGAGANRPPAYRFE
jgi:hypothetical protein